jgi:transcription elongation factor Elf1
MPEDFDSSDTALELTCPACSASDRDVFEVIETRTLTRLQCSSCRASFRVWLDECRVCGEELLVTLPEDAKSAIAHLPDECAACHVHGAFHEDQCSHVEAVA